MKSNDLCKVKCYVFDLGTMREGLRGMVSEFGRTSCSRFYKKSIKSVLCRSLYHETLSMVDCSAAII